MALAPVPVGVFDGSLKQENVDNFKHEKNLLSNKTQIKELRNIVQVGTTAELLQKLPNTPSLYQLSDLLCFASGAGRIDHIEALTNFCKGNNLEKLVNSKNKTGRTALHWAARNGKLEACKLLVSLGADVQYKTLDGITSVSWAVWSGDIPTVRYLISKGGNYKQVNRWGCDLTHWASANGSVQLVKYLESLGLSFQRKNNQGHDGLMKAGWNGHLPLVKYLLFQNVEIEKRFALCLGSLSICDETYCTKLDEANLQIIRKLKNKDRAGLTVLEISRINKKKNIVDYLNPFFETLGGKFSCADEKCNICVQIKLGSEDTQGRNERISKAFKVYYRTQGILNNENETFLSLEQNVSFRIRTSTVLRNQIVKRLVRYIKNTSDLTISKRAWLEEKELQNLCLSWQKFGFLEIDYRSESEYIIFIQVIKKITESKRHWLLLGDEDLSFLNSYFSLFDNENILSVLACGTNAKLLMQESASLRKYHATAKLILAIANSQKFPVSNVANHDVFVHCKNSSDGDVRLNPHLASEELWSFSTGVKNHEKNSKLLRKALALVEVGKHVLYFSRSLNPLENEAVVARALKAFSGKFELVDFSGVGNCKPKMSWVLLKGHSLFRYLTSWSEVPEEDKFPNGPIRRTLFPDWTEDSIKKELLKAIRVSPTYEKTHPGFFFLAVFRRKLPEKHIFSVENTKNFKQQLAFKSSFSQHVESLSSESYIDISSFFSLVENMPLVVKRSKQSETICTMSEENFMFLSSLQNNPKIDILHCGLDMFQNLDRFMRTAENRWFISQGAASVSSFMTCSGRKMSLAWLKSTEEGCLIVNDILRIFLQEGEVNFKDRLEFKKFEQEIQARFSPGPLLLEICSTGTVALSISSILLPGRLIMQMNSTQRAVYLNLLK
eukprot:augustus_masked-scaffold_56-processed-gene-0.6-mRNA-1 protein AED:0.46 eAED:0.46 QI:0/0/0/0.5/1/1/2/0/894